MKCTSKLLSLFFSTLILLGHGYAQASQTHLFILSGNSNMKHMELDPENIAGTELPYDPAIASNYPDDSPIAFTPTLSEAFPDDEIIIVKDARGAPSMDRWDDGKFMWQDLTTAIDSALVDKTFTTVTFVWMQGENDYLDDADTLAYRSRLESLYQRLQAYLDVTEMNWVIGRLNDYALSDPNWVTLRDIQMTTADAFERATWVNFDDLNGEENSKQLQSTTEYSILGNRWANAAISLIKTHDLGLPPPAQDTATDSMLTASDFTLSVIDQQNTALNHSLSDVAEVPDVIATTTNGQGVSFYADENSRYADSISFAHLAIDEDYQFTVKLDDITADSYKGYTGIMMRSSLADDAPFVSIAANKNGQIKYHYRHSFGDKSASSGSSTITANWLKLVRKGPLVSVYTSADSLNWEFIGEQGINSETTMYAGLFGYSSNLAYNMNTRYGEVKLERLPQLNISGGVYSEAVNLHFVRKNLAAEYRYTLDGSTPTNASMLFAEQLSISQDSKLTISEFIDGVPQYTWPNFFVFGDENQFDTHYRPLHFSYGGTGGGSRLAQSDDEVLAALMNFPKKPTVLTPVILNEDPVIFEPFISQLKQIVPKMYFGLGRGKSTGEHETFFPKTYDDNIEMARKFRRYTSAIRIENFGNILDKSGDETMDAEAYMVKFLNELHDMGFTDIMLNPWEPRPFDAELGEVYEKWPHATSTFFGTGKSKWVAPESRINKVAEYNNDLAILVNYENAPRHIALAEIELAHQADPSLESSIDIMNYVVQRQADYDALGAQDPSLVRGFKWCPPWSQNYDPIALGTLDWIAEMLEELNP